MFLPLLPLQPFSCQSAAARPARRRERGATEQLRGRRTQRGTEQSGVFCSEGDHWTDCKEVLDTDLRVHGLPAVRERATSIPLSHWSYSAKG